MVGLETNLHAARVTLCTTLYSGNFLLLNRRMQYLLDLLQYFLVLYIPSIHSFRLNFFSSVITLLELVNDSAIA